MDSYLGLFLMVIISLASIVLADVLVQPGYKYQYDNNPQYQSVTQYRIQSPAAQYHAQLSPNKHPTAIDSLPLEHEPTDTNDKRMENRQSKNYHLTRPLGMYPEKIYPGYHQAQNTNEYIKSFSNPSMITFPNMITFPSTITFPENGDSAETCVNYRDPRILTSRDSIRSKEKENEEEDEAPTDIIYDRYYDNNKYRDVQAVIDRRLFEAMQNSIGYYWPGRMYFSTPLKPPTTPNYKILRPSKPQRYEPQVILQR